MMTFLKSSALMLLAANSLATEETTGTIGNETKASTFTVQLGRQHVPVMVGDREVAKKTAYYGNIFVGYPLAQQFTVVFDTGSGHVFLPSSECHDEPCKHHQTYKRKLSASHVDIDHNGLPELGTREERDMVSIVYGTGEIVGDFVREAVCIGMAPPKSLPPGAKTTPKTLGKSREVVDLPTHCTQMRLITAKTMSAEPFSFFKFDGVLGLGLNALALDPEFNFFGQLAKDAQIEPIFSFFISRSDDVPSEITFGGSDASRLAAPMHWVPVFAPEQGFWKVWIQSIRVGSEKLPFCDDGECSAIVDTGTSVLGVPTESMDDFVWKTAQEVPTSADEAYDCRNGPGQTIIFEVSGGFTVELAAGDYMRPVPSDVPAEDGNRTQQVCRANLLPLDMPSLGEKVFLWGAPVLQKYYTSYDANGERVGFAPALHPDVRSKEEANLEII